GVAQGAGDHELDVGALLAAVAPIDAVAGRLEPDHATPRRWNPDRARPVARMGDCDGAGCDGGAGPARGAAGGAARVPGIVGRALVEGPGDRLQAELG